MTKTLDLAPNLRLPLDAVTQRIALLARTGAGKTYAAGVLVEEMLDAGAVVGIVDPTGVWWGLKSSADGKRAGFPVLVLGDDERADLPLNPHAGAFLARWFCEANVSAVFNVRSFGENDMKRFVAEFAGELFKLKLKKPSPLHLVFDEADEWAPQSASLGGYAGKCLSAMQNLVRRGRVAGIGTTLISQRSAAIAKSVLSQTELLIALQTNAPQDLKAIEDWIKHAGDPAKASEILAALPKMKPASGEAMVYSPGWLDILQRVQFRKKKTYDSSKTPKVGEKLEPPRKLASLDLDSLAEEMKRYADEAKANDPEELKKEISRLRRELNAKRTGYTDEELDEAVRRAVSEAEKRFAARLQRPAHQAMTAAKELERLAGIPEVPEEIVRPRYQEKPAPVAREPRPAPRPSTNGSTFHVGKEGSIPDRVLAVAAAFHPEALPEKRHATLARTTHTSSSWRGALAQLRSAGLIEHGKPVRLTEAGQEAAKHVPPIPQPGDELVAFWREAVGGDGVPGKLFDALASRHGAWADAEVLAEEAGTVTTSSTWRGAKAEINKLGILESSGSSFRLSPEIFG